MKLILLAVCFSIYSFSESKPLKEIKVDALTRDTLVLIVNQEARNAMASSVQISGCFAMGILVSELKTKLSDIDCDMLLLQFNSGESILISSPMSESVFEVKKLLLLNLAGIPVDQKELFEIMSSPYVQGGSLNLTESKNFF